MLCLVCERFMHVCSCPRLVMTVSSEVSQMFYHWEQTSVIVNHHQMNGV